MSTMRLVEYCQHFPGEAVGGGGSADVIDTGIEIQAHGRLYIGHPHAIEIGTAAGMATPQALAAAEEKRDRLQDELDAQAVEVRALKAALEEAESLRQAIAYTLQRGVVVDQKTQKLGLRSVPGQKRVSIDDSLWKTYVESVETEPVAA